MSEVFYVLLLTLFGVLAVATLTQYSVNGSALREELTRARGLLAEQQGHLAALRGEMQDLDTECELLDLERVSLDEQVRCMRDLERFVRPGSSSTEGGKQDG